MKTQRRWILSILIGVIIREFFIPLDLSLFGHACAVLLTVAVVLGSYFVLPTRRG